MLAVAFGAVAAMLPAEPVAGQPRFHELDVGHPTVTEDAMAVARYQLDARIGSVASESFRAGAFDVGVQPELVYGSWQGGQIRGYVPVLLRGADEMGARVSAIGLSVLQNVTLETERSPALGVAAGVDILLDGGARSGSVPWVKAIATRTLSFGRVHLNGRYTFGGLEPSVSAAWMGTGATRWLAGLGVDKALPLESLLLVGEVYGLGLASDKKVRWHATGGLRYQPTPGLVLDGAIGRALRGDEAAWSIVVGVSHSWAVRSLMPRWFR